MGAIPAAGINADTGGRRWLFADAEFDERTFELRVHGEPAELERKPLEVLLHLLRHAGEIVTKEELLSAVWPGRVLTDNSLPKSVSRIREVLGDEEQAVIKTVHGYGYRLVAPVEVKSSRAAPALTQLDLQPGDHPPLRPLWSLVRRLGGGGQGEVWLVQHDKTGEERVYKFALDLAGLAAIKREITLNRFLRESLEGRDAFTRVLDWNLEEAPYYLELEHGAGGNLESWAEASGGLGSVSLATRLEVVARIADALAAAHSVGVLHKDLKPANVLIVAERDGAPGIKLADFGSGGVLDPQRLEQMGITRLGFTRSVMQGEAAATAMYLAPEVMAGQPATVQADVYSLGVLLYQMVAGNLRQPLAPGWEQRVGDPLLCEDIALAVAGEPAQRLADAAALGQRLRSLDERHRLRTAEEADKLRLQREQLAATERARRAELALERLRARRQWMLTVVSVLVVGVSLSLGLYLEARRARNEAARAATSSREVADFLSKDMFAVVGSQPLRDLTVRQLLESAAASLSLRPGLMPEAAARIHAALGSAFWTMEAIEDAEAQLSRAQRLYEQVEGPGSVTAIGIAAQHLFARGMLERLPEDLSAYEQLLANGRREHGPLHPAVLLLQNNLAHARFDQGQYRRAADEFAALMGAARAAPAPDPQLIGTAGMMRGHLLFRLGDLAGASAELREALTRLATIPGAAPVVAQSKSFLGLVLVEQERFDEAEAELARALELAQPWAMGGSNTYTLAIEVVRARLLHRRGQAAAAIAVLAPAIEAVAAQPWNQRRDRTAEHRTWLAQAQADAGRLDQAEAAFRRALDISAIADGPAHPVTQSARIGLAEVLLHRQAPAEAERVVSTVDLAALDALGPGHPLRAEWLRVSGLAALQTGRTREAGALLQQALQVLEISHGERHALVARTRAELARAGTPAAERP